MKEWERYKRVLREKGKKETLQLNYSVINKQKTY